VGTVWYKRMFNRFVEASHTAKQRTQNSECLSSTIEKETNPSNSKFTFNNLNVEAARRQATLGRDYAPHSKTQERLEELKKSTVTLPPHRPWTGVYTNWTADPLKDLNWRFQFQTLRWINPYLWDALDGNQESKVEWKRIVRSWADNNTPPERAKDKYAWMDMSDGNRAIQISIGAPLIESHDTWYIDLLVQHRNWLMDDTKIVKGNHGFHQNLGLFVVAAVLNDEIGINRAIERLTAQVSDVFEEKGLNEEGSVAYHQTNLDWWLQAKKRIELEGYSFPQRAVDRLDNAGKTMGYLLLPDGTMPQIGDGGRGKGRLGLHPFLDQVIRRTIQDNNLPTFNHYKYGMTILRSGWGENRPLTDESHTIIRHGKDLRRHSHNDRGSVHIYTSGRRWITDGGFHSYQRRNRDRTYTKSRAAHSLIDIPRQKYDKTGDVPVLFTEDSKTIKSLEIFDSNFSSARWCRRVIFLPTVDVWVIWDRVQLEETDQVQQQWLLDVGVTVDVLMNAAIASDDKDRKLYMRWFGDQPELDAVVGDPSSGWKRGLIGVAWKKMKAATSLHANFQAETVDSILVVSSTPFSDQTLELHKYKRMTSFSLQIGDEMLDVGLNRTTFCQEN